MTAASQWLHATTGRIATCPHSWMTAVHWITHCAAQGLYTPSSSHSPKWGPTTIAVAQEIAALKECRPSVDYLARKLKASVRTIKYHLAMLRETGLLVYRSKGTRIAGIGGRASEFERTIPAAFDEALGIRTVGEGATRRPVGAAPESRTLLGKLAKKATRKTRRRPRRTPVSGRGRCTPMQGGTSMASPTALTHIPSESKLASGEAKSPTPKSSKRGPQKLNKVGRRYQLARQLIAQVPWLRNASTARIAWIIRHVADAGWTVTEVQAAAERYVSHHDAKRPSAVLAWRLGSVHLLHTTPDSRRALVEDWRDSRRAEQARHQEAFIPAQAGPQSPAARRAWDEAFTEIQASLTPVAETPADETPLALEDLTKDEIVAMRLDAMKDPSLIFASLELIGEHQTRRLYTSRLVDQTLAIEAINNRRRTLTPAF
ncbi:helix-turn-helix domain-containing protein [Streptomyces longwoodensis]|uniref:helix-turn-helix domain-containing protein n=1 Tax=Streptomyces longwoodensis TaxID=68231 RepID=UPI0022590A7A|nr:helix-turn-helix domain-containing protein [Streptomyces longwoodensis]MCX5000945.1 helix-turn-helix domain-containing protein [Streptomyces longwoodensis]